MRRPSLPKLPRLPKPPKLPKLPKLRRKARPGPGEAPAPVPLGARARATNGKRRPVLIGLGAVIVIVALFLVVKSCGGDDEKAARQTVERFAAASRDKDYQELCDELLSSSIVEQLRSTGLPCEVALRKGLSNVQNPTVDVQSVDIKGDTALVRTASRAAGQPPSEDTVELHKENGHWRITSLANEPKPDTVP
ncbi:MAG: hypothetical protein QOG15_1209 [Solirubrobacteraceae bacterium]|nr:hypothetical protein [Solirubrobacteraceae bacterium]